VQLQRRPTAEVGDYPDKESAREALARVVDRMRDLHELLWAQDRWALLLIFQGMDASGKDAAIKRVTSGLNPQGVHVTSFKQPSAEELDHDFLWRTTKVAPERGRIGVFNRSYYEETLVVRVHPELLGRQRLPPSLVTRRIWKDRFDDIVNHELHLARNGTVIRKFFMHVSKAEQRRRFLERLDNPMKYWKFNAGDVAERKLWDAYQKAYEETLTATSAEHAPWYAVPADKKWFAHLVIAHVIIDALQSLELAPPALTEAHRREREEARKLLMRERG